MSSYRPCGSSNALLHNLARGNTGDFVRAISVCAALAVSGVHLSVRMSVKLLHMASSAIELFFSAKSIIVEQKRHYTVSPAAFSAGALINVG